MHTKYFQDTHKYMRHIIMDSGNPITITEVLTLFPRYQDIPQLVSYLCYEELSWCQYSHIIDTLEFLLFSRGGQERNLGLIKLQI